MEPRLTRSSPSFLSNQTSPTADVVVRRRGVLLTQAEVTCRLTVLPSSCLDRSRPTSGTGLVPLLRGGVPT